MERLKAYMVMGASYLVALAAAFGIWLLCYNNMPLYIAVLLADIAATVVVWVFGLIFKNSSFYDAYWSVLPWVIVLFLMVWFNAYSALNILFLCVFSLWSWRLTINWAYTCKNLKTQDWRYVKFKQENKVWLWHIINFFGINFMPTMFVFVALMPAIAFVPLSLPFNALSLFGAVVILGGTTIELFADVQMHRFRLSAESGEIMNQGLWKHSRHPNYLGEISVWVGVYLFMLPLLPLKWFLGIGAVLMACLFVFISIPLMEKRQVKRRAKYADYQKQTSMLLLLPRKKTR